MDKVRHKGTPAEPFATVNAYGTITRTAEGRPRVTPSGQGIPALAHVAWGEGPDEYHTWERLSDLTVLKDRKR